MAKKRLKWTKKIKCLKDKIAFHTDGLKKCIRCRNAVRSGYTALETLNKKLDLIEKEILLLNEELDRP